MNRGCLLFSALLACALAIGVAPARANDPVAILDGEAISLEEFEKPIGSSIAALKEQIFRLQRQRLDDLIHERLLAKEARRRGISVDALLNEEVAAKLEPVTEAEVETFYRQNQSRLGLQEPDLRARIRAHLQQQKLDARRETFLSQLRARADVQILLREPPVYRAEIATDGAPFKGAPDAPVVIVKFEDFHCPFCKEAQPTLERLLSSYPNQIKLVHKDFPIDELHPGARAAHIAARCAGEQGKFWPYHDALYRGAPKTAEDDLRAYAIDAGLDLVGFERCLASETFAALVQANLDEGRQVGVSGTPAFFINGRLVSGAQPVERFMKIIEEELARRP